MMKKAIAAVTAITLVFMSGCGALKKGRSGATLEIDLSTSYVGEEFTMSGMKVQPVSLTSKGLVVIHTNPTGTEVKYYLQDPAGSSFTEIPVAESCSAMSGNVFFSDLPDGRLCGMYQVKTGRQNGWDATDCTHFVQAVYDDQMQITETRELGSFPEGGQLRLLNANPDGSWVVQYIDEESYGTTYLMNADFTQQYEITEPMYADWVVTGKSGTVYVMGGSMYRLDTTTGKTEPVFTDALPFRYEQIFSAPADAEYELYYTDEIGIHGLNLDMSTGLVVDFRNSDFYGNFYSVYALPDKQFVGNFWGSDYVRQDGIFRLRPRTEEEIANTQFITLAGIELNSILIREVARYNQTQNDIHIVMKDYAFDAAADDPNYYNYLIHTGWSSEYDPNNINVMRSRAVEQFKNDLLSGIVPDLICMDGMPYQMLSNKGLLTDLQPKLDNEERFDPNDYCMNFIDGLKRGDRLERIGFSCNIDTTIGKTRLVGEKQGRTPEEYVQMIESVPEGMEIVAYYECRENYMQYFVTEGQAAFIDRGNMTCTFDSDAFVKLLELCNRVKPRDEVFTENYWMEHQEMHFSDDDMLLTLFDMENPYVYHEYHTDPMYFNREDITLVGYPDASGGNGGRYRMSFTLSMSSRSDKPDEIWEFFMNELDSKRQSNMCLIKYGGGNSLPIHKQALENTMKAATIGMPGKSGATEEEMTILRDYIDGVRLYADTDPVISNIIEEEAAMYFSGDRTARQAAEMIQSRCSLYLSEQK